MTDFYRSCAHPKPLPRKLVKARKDRVHSDHVAETRLYVAGRERGICRCCRWRLGESMHELRPRSLGGKISKRNSVWVCGDGVKGCHGFLQRHEIGYVAGERGAEDLLAFSPQSDAAAEWLKIKRDAIIESPVMQTTESVSE